MDILEINVPNYNDSFSRVVLNNTQYLIRFTWNDTAQRWGFGLYTMLREPIAVGIRIVPRFPLNLQIMDNAFPFGVFGVFTEFPAIGRNDFMNGNARFTFIPNQSVEE